MKAVILAGGTGTRLHPISLNRPKPMVRLLDRPLLEHIILLLKKHGITDICITLCYLPDHINEYFKDGSALGVNISTVTEEKALGTAGGVKLCSDFIGDDDFIVISGDAACDFNVSELIERHKSSGSEATLALYRAQNPSEYGIVLTESGGKVAGFIEKPSIGQAYTDTINTGIYVLSSKILSEIPSDKPCDFAKDVFPRLLKEKRPMFAFDIDGYWCDIGNCEAYIRSNMDALHGILPVMKDISEPLNGIRSLSQIPDGVTLTPPCFIGKNVSIAPGADIGPDCIIGENSVIGEDTKIRESIIYSSRVERGCDISGALICPDCVIGGDSTVYPGCIIADGCTIGAGCVLDANIKLWCGKSAVAGSHISSSITSQSKFFSPIFDFNGHIAGSAVSELTPEVMRIFGETAASFGTAAAAFCGGSYARIAAEAYLGGAAFCGAEAYLLDAPFEASAAFAAKSFCFASTLFIRQNGDELTLSFFGDNGLTAGRDFQRKLEAAAAGTPVSHAEVSAGDILSISGCELLHGSAAAKAAFQGFVQDAVCAVSGRGGAAHLLCSALSRAGIKTVPAADGVIELRPSKDGFELSAIAENGLSFDNDKLIHALVYAELRLGGRELAVPYSAPTVTELMAEKLGGRVLRLYRDGDDAEKLYASAPYCFDAAFMAVRLLSFLSAAGGKLSDIMKTLPQYYTASADIHSGCSRAQFLKKLGISYSDGEFVSGVRINGEKGTALIRPAGINAYRISVESFREEYAAELCAEFEKRLE